MKYLHLEASSPPSSFDVVLRRLTKHSPINDAEGCRRCRRSGGSCLPGVPVRLVIVLLLLEVVIVGVSSGAAGGDI